MRLSLKEHREKTENIRKRIMDVCLNEANHSAVQHIQNIFRKKENSLFQWVRSPDIPADNNFAERWLRPSVVARNISSGSHSEKGFETREIIMTVRKTAEASGYDPESFLKNSLDKIPVKEIEDTSTIFASL